MSDGDEAVNTVVSTFGLWWPDAEQDDIRAGAQAWDRFAHALDTARDGGRTAAARALTGSDGPAAQAFAAHWESLARVLAEAAESARAIARALREFADEVEQAKHQVEEAAVEAGVAIVLGTVGAFFTFGATEVAADGVAGVLVSNAARIGVQLSARAAQIAGRIVAEAGFGAVQDAGGNAINQIARVEGFHDGGYSLPELGQAAGGGALGGGAGRIVQSAGTTRAAFRDRHGVMTDGKYRVNPAAQAKHLPESAAPGKSIFYPDTDPEKLALDAARRADEGGLWAASNPSSPSGHFAGKAKVDYDNPIGTHGATGLPTSTVNVYRKKTGTIHIAPGSAE